MYSLELTLVDSDRVYRLDESIARNSTLCYYPTTKFGDVKEKVSKQFVVITSLSMDYVLCHDVRGGWEDGRHTQNT